MTTSISRPARRSSPGRLLLLALAMFAVGIILAVWGGRQVFEAYNSKNWPTTEGTITSSYVHKREGSPSDKNKQPTYHVKINYEYTVDGTRYTGERIRFTDNADRGRDKAKGLADEYFADQTVTVYYNPEDPGIAILKPGFVFSTFIPFLGGLAFLFAGILCFKTYGRARLLRESR
jgi:hypothetical protein